jgi:hypothetical protein
MENASPIAEIERSKKRSRIHLSQARFTRLAMAIKAIINGQRRQWQRRRTMESANPSTEIERSEKKGRIHLSQAQFTRPAMAIIRPKARDGDDKW